MRISRVKFIGVSLRKTLHSLLPRWEDSATISLILERESLAAMIAAITILVFLVLVRISLGWYGEACLGIHSIGISQRLRRAYPLTVAELTQALFMCSFFCPPFSLE